MSIPTGRIKELLDVQQSSSDDLKLKAYNWYFRKRGINTTAIDTVLEKEYFSLLGPFAIAAGLFYLGYQVKKIRDPAESIADSLKHLSQTADEVKVILQNIYSDLKRIIEEIERLIKEIKGVISEAFVKDAIGEADGRRQIIIGYASDQEVFLKNLQIVEFQLNELVAAAGRIRGNSVGGMSYLFQVAPIFSLWIQTFEMVEKAKSKQYRTYAARKFEEQPFYKENLDLFRTLIIFSGEKAQEYLKTKETSSLYLKSASFNYYVLDKDNGILVHAPLLLPRDISVETSIVYRYKVEWLLDDNNQRVTAKLMYYWWSREAGELEWKGGKRELNTDNPAEFHVYEAFRTKHQSLMHDVEHHLSFNPEVQEYKDKILKIDSQNKIVHTNIAKEASQYSAKFGLLAKKSDNTSDTPSKGLDTDKKEFQRAKL